MTDHDPDVENTRPVERSPQPPAYDPYGNPYRDPNAASFQHAVPHPAPQPAHRGGWSWRSSLAGAVAGGVIAASIAVPVSWALADGGGSSVADSPSAAAPQRPQQPQPDTGGQLGDGSGGSFGYGAPDQQGGSTSSQAGNQTDATADQAKGVVLIETTTTAGEAAGTGLVLDSSGLVLTNYHVVEGSTSVSVTVATTGETYDATVVGHDQTADVALLQLEDASGLATVDLDQNGDPSVSDAVTAVGNAQGQGFLSASTGSVVALDQSIDTQSEGTVDGEHLTGLIETDAYVVGGYSGGALLDSDGDVVGITTAASSGGETQSYAVPIEDALDVAQQIEDGKGSDEVQVGPSAYLGVSISESTDGVQVGQIENGGAAAGAGVEAGSIITGLGDTSITSLDELQSTLAAYEPGDSVTLKWTDTSGADHSERVTLGESPVN
jgi:S1-C subfamily serine protease